MPSLTRFIIKISLFLVFGLVSLYLLAVFFEPTPREMRHTIYDFSEMVDKQENELDADTREEASDRDEN